MTTTTFKSARLLNTSMKHQLSPLSPADIFNALSEHVVGQHQVKLAISVGMYKHLVGIKFRARSGTQQQKKQESPPVNDPLVDRRAMEGFGLHDSEVRQATEEANRRQRGVSFDDNNAAVEVVPGHVRLPNGKVVHTQNIDKTNILIMGPTGEQPLTSRRDMNTTYMYDAFVVSFWMFGLMLWCCGVVVCACIVAAQNINVCFVQARVRRCWRRRWRILWGCPW